MRGEEIYLKQKYYKLIYSQLVKIEDSVDGSYERGSGGGGGVGGMHIHI